MQKTKTIVQLALLVGIVLLMSFTPIGYLKLGVIELSFLTIPVVIGAVILGPNAGAFLGGVFGLSSFIQCFGSSPFGVALMGINPIFTFIVCMVPRVFMGWACGMVFKGLNRANVNKTLSCSIAGLCGALLNTVGFVGLLVALFWNTEYIQGLAQTMGSQSILTFAVAFAGVNSLVEAGVCTVISGIVCRVLLLDKSKAPQ